MKSQSAFSLFLAVLFLFQTPTGHAKLFGSQFDLVLQGSPISIRELQKGIRVDALDGAGDPSVTRYVVLFQIEKTLVGQLAKMKQGGPGRLEQAGDAVKSKQFLGIFSLKDPNTETERETFSVAVQNPGEVFGITPGESVPSRSYKLYFIRISKKSEPEAFIFVKARPVKK